MDPHDRHTIKAAARNALVAAPYDPRKIILLHTGISLAVSFLFTLISFLLEQQIQNTGGLGGLGTRSLLSTVQSVMQVLLTVAVPFWEAGFCFAAINMARQKEAAPPSLLEGFRRFGPLLRASLLQGIVYLGVGILSFTVGSRIFMMTPLSDPLYEILQTVDFESTLMGPELILDEATATAMMDAYTPMLLIIAVLLIAVSLIVSYRFRIVNYLLLDYPGMKAMEAIRLSGHQLRGHKMALFKLDLSFLWFYLLGVLASVLAYGDYLLILLGVPLPFSTDAAYFVFLLLSLVCQGGLYFWARNRVEVTYALFYDLTALPIRKENQ